MNKTSETKSIYFLYKKNNEIRHYTYVCLFYKTEHRKYKPKTNETVCQKDMRGDGVEGLGTGTDIPLGIWFDRVLTFGTMSCFIRIQKVK